MPCAEHAHGPHGVSRRGQEARRKRENECIGKGGQKARQLGEGGLKQAIVEGARDEANNMKGGSPGDGKLAKPAGSSWMGLKQMAERVVLACPTFQGQKAEPLFIPGELTTKRWRFKPALTVYCSHNNPGAKEAMQARVAIREA